VLRAPTGAKQINPRKEAAFRYDPQLKRTHSATASEPVILRLRAERGEPDAECAMPPERFQNGIAFEAVDACPHAQLGRRHQLRVQAADLANHAYEVGRCSSLHEVMALHPPGEGLLPREVAPSSEFRHQFFA
jgi:hypothetical protein